MKVQTMSGIVPRVADILMIGIDPDRFDDFQRAVKASLQSEDWEYVANLGKTFEYVIYEFLPKRPELDLVYITNEIELSAEKLRCGATKLSYELAKYMRRPRVVLHPDLAWLRPVFHARGIKVSFSIEDAMKELYAEKCIAQSEAA